MNVDLTYFSELNLDVRNKVTEDFIFYVYTQKIDFYSTQLKVSNSLINARIDLIDVNHFTIYKYPLLQRILLGIKPMGLSIEEASVLIEKLLAEEDVNTTLGDKELYLPILFDSRKYNYELIPQSLLIGNIEKLLDISISGKSAEECKELLLSSNLFIKRYCKILGISSKFTFFTANSGQNVHG